MARNEIKCENSFSDIVSARMKDNYCGQQCRWNCETYIKHVLNCSKFYATANDEKNLPLRSSPNDRFNVMATRFEIESN